MNNSNIVDFTVDGVGSFKAHREAPVKTFFLDRRRELGRIVGGLSELVKIETTIRQLTNSPDSEQKGLAKELTYELTRANAFLDVKDLLVSVPKGFSLEKLSAEDFNKLLLAMESAKMTLGDSGTIETDKPAESSHSD